MEKLPNCSEQKRTNKIKYNTGTPTEQVILKRKSNGAPPEYQEPLHLSLSAVLQLQGPDFWLYDTKIINTY